MEQCNCARVYIYVGLPCGSVVKNLPANAGDMGLISGLGRSPEKDLTTNPVFLLAEFHGQRSLVGYSPWSRI